MVISKQRLITTDDLITTYATLYLIVVSSMTLEDLLSTFIFNTPQDDINFTQLLSIKFMGKCSISMTYFSNIVYHS